MCKFKSGIILKNKVILAPTYNDSHSRLLKSLGIEDNHYNATTKFIRAELIPPEDRATLDIKEWRYVVDQDVTPEWYNVDPKRYEEEFRSAVEDWVKENMIIAAGLSWLRIKTDGDKAYYLLNGILKRSEFGKNNNYATSYIREYLNKCDVVKELKNVYGDKLAPITINLTSLDGLKDYGKVEGDLLSLMDIDLYRECRENITSADEAFWLATPNSTPSGCGSGNVRYVYSDGCVYYCWYDDVGGVRPFFILQS